MPLTIVRNDIARVRADALVNAANSHLVAGGGVCGAIFDGAGRAEMEAACRSIGRCETGDAVVTPAFGLHARYVIHAVGPVWAGGGRGEEALLASAYRSVFARAEELGVGSVALPLISAGIFGYPVTASMQLATAAAQTFLAENPDVVVTLVVYDRAAFAESLRRFSDVASYVDDAEVSQDRDDRLRALSSLEAMDFLAAGAEAPDETGQARAASRPAEPSGRPSPPAHRPAATESRPAPAPRPSSPVDEQDLLPLLENLDASFSQTVLALIDERGLTDAEVYKRANLSRQLFSKLRRDAGYRPTKQTAVALAMALGLDLDETSRLLARAGFALSHASRFDIIVEYFLAHGCHDVFQLNEMLFAFDQPLVGSL